MPDTAGNRTVKAVWPGREATVTVPPWASTIEATMARPNPLEPISRDRALSARTNLPNRFGRIASGMPGPSSLIVNYTIGSAGSAADATEVVTVTPSGVCILALDSRLATNCCSRT